VIKYHAGASISSFRLRFENVIGAVIGNASTNDACGGFQYGLHATNALVGTIGMLAAAVARVLIVCGCQVTFQVRIDIALNARRRLRNDLGSVEAFRGARHVMAQTGAAVGIKVSVQDTIQIDLSLRIAPRRHEGIVQTVKSMGMFARKHVGIPQRRRRRRFVARARLNNRTKDKEQTNKRKDDLCHGSVCNDNDTSVNNGVCADAKLRIAREPYLFGSFGK
jgi:hypothetical protein